MEPDALKAAWQALDRRLALHDRIELEHLRERRLDRVRGTLRPLAWGQLAQIAFGLGFVLLASLLWMRAGTPPRGLPMGTLLAGIVVHAYGVAAIALAGETLRRLRGIDYAAPVLDIQKQLAALRRSHVLSGMVAGLPWWFLWVPILVVLAGLGGVDLWARAPGVVWIGLAVGAAGLLGTRAVHRWSRHPHRADIGKALDDAVTGARLRKAQAALAEIRRFEQE